MHLTCQANDSLKRALRFELHHESNVDSIAFDWFSIFRWEKKVRNQSYWRILQQLQSFFCWTQLLYRKSVISFLSRVKVRVIVREKAPENNFMMCEFEEKLFAWMTEKKSPIGTCIRTRRMWHRWRCRGNSTIITAFFEMIYDRVWKHVCKFYVTRIADLRRDRNYLYNQINGFKINNYSRN